MSRAQTELARSNARKALLIACLTTGVSIAVLSAFVLHRSSRVSLALRVGGVTLSLKAHQSWDALQGIRVESLSLNSFREVRFGLASPCDTVGDCRSSSVLEMSSVTATTELSRFSINADHLTHLFLPAGGDLRVSWDRDEPQLVVFSTDAANVSGQLAVSGVAQVQCASCKGFGAAKFLSEGIVAGYRSPTGFVVDFHGSDTGLGVSLRMLSQQSLTIPLGDQIDRFGFLTTASGGRLACTIIGGSIDVPGLTQPHIELNTTDRNCLSVDKVQQMSGSLIASGDGLLLNAAGVMSGLRIGTATDLHNTLPTIQESLATSSRFQAYWHTVVFLVSFIVPYIGLKLRKT